MILFYHDYILPALQNYQPFVFLWNDIIICNRRMSCTPKQDSETDAICQEQLVLQSDVITIVQQSIIISDLIWLEQLPQKQNQHIPKDRKEQLPNCRKWATKETQDFYNLLEKMGPDFSQMEIHQIFAGKRNKRQLKNKFRKEQRINSSKIEITLNCFFDRPLISLAHQRGKQYEK